MVGSCDCGIVIDVALTLLCSVLLMGRGDVPAEDVEKIFLTPRRLYSKNRVRDRLHAVAAAPANCKKDHGLGLPSEVFHVLHRCLQKSPGICLFIPVLICV
jgi:hypothetical protein